MPPDGLRDSLALGLGYVAVLVKIVVHYRAGEAGAGSLIVFQMMMSP